jgi:hypothetical protein
MPSCAGASDDGGQLENDVLSEKFIVNSGQEWGGPRCCVCHIAAAPVRRLCDFGTNTAKLEFGVPNLECGVGSAVFA